MEKGKNLKKMKSRYEKSKKLKIYEAAIRQSLSGFALFEIIYGENNKISGLEFIEVNNRFHEMFQTRSSDIIGKSFEEIFPDLISGMELYNKTLPGLFKSRKPWVYGNYITQFQSCYTVQLIPYGRKLLLMYCFEASPEQKQIDREEAVKEKTEEMTRRAAEKVAEEVTEEAREEITEEVREEITEEVTEKAAERIIKRTAEGTVEDLSQEITKKTTEETNKEFNKETIKEADENLTKVITLEVIQGTAADLARVTNREIFDGEAEEILEETALPALKGAAEETTEVEAKEAAGKYELAGSINDVDFQYVKATMDLIREDMNGLLLYQSCHDPLTGLYNRKFYEAEWKLLNKKTNYPISLILADINGLKLINEAFGRAQGDKMLAALADILKKECRSGDFIARSGGDEFAVLLPRINSNKAEKMVDRFRIAVNSTSIDKLRLSVSFGYKTKYSMEAEYDTTYKLAEEAVHLERLNEGKIYKDEILEVIRECLYEKSPREQIHSERVSMICKAIGTVLGMASKEVAELGLAGLLHDIGKNNVSRTVLNKAANLNEEEWAEMKRHPVYGCRILRHIDEYTEIAEYVLLHHERPDGRGYPKGLRSEQLPLKVRILSIAEAFDEMTGGNQYRKPLSIKEAINELRKNSGTQFDGELVNIFIEKVLKED